MCEDLCFFKSNLSAKHRVTKPWLGGKLAVGHVQDPAYNVLNGIKGIQVIFKYMPSVFPINFFTVTSN